MYKYLVITSYSTLPDEQEWYKTREEAEDAYRFLVEHDIRAMLLEVIKED